MYYSHINYGLLSLSTMLIVLVTQADPIIFIKNNSKRPVHIDPFGRQGGSLLPRAQFVKAGGEYKEDNVSADKVAGVRVKYCPNDISCTTSDEVRASGITAQFDFTDPNATKYYLKLDIDKNDVITLKQQEGIKGRTSNLRWSLEGNIADGAIKESSGQALPKQPSQASQHKNTPKQDLESTIAKEKFFEDVKGQIASLKSLLKDLQTYQKDYQKNPAISRARFDNLRERRLELGNFSINQMYKFESDVRQSKITLSSAEKNTWEKLSREYDSLTVKARNTVDDIFDLIQPTNNDQ